MREKDITEKALENCDDVFADVVNAPVFDGEEVVKEKQLEHPQEVADLLYALTKDERFNINVEKRKMRRSREMMRSKMLDRAEARGEVRGEARGREAGLNDAMYMVRLFMEGNDISKIAEVIGKEEAVVRKRLAEAKLMQE